MFFDSIGIVRHHICDGNGKHYCATVLVSEEFQGTLPNLIPTGNNGTHIFLHIAALVVFEHFLLLSLSTYISCQQCNACHSNTAFYRSHVLYISRALNQTLLDTH